MHRFSDRLRNACLTFLMVVSFYSLHALATGDAISFTAMVGGTTHTAIAPSMDRGGVVYVSLAAVVRQLGGGCKILSSRIQVDFAGTSAWLIADSPVIDASVKRFLIDKPILTQNTDVLIAAQDVVPLFKQAFRVDVRQAPSQDVQAAVPSETVPLPSISAASSGALPGALQPTVSPPGRAAINTVVIDPGHGGSDDGCSGAGGYKEKELTLAVARRVQTELQKTFSGNVVLTRSGDLDVSLAQSVRTANQFKDALLISLHAGSSASGSARGAEVFCLPLETRDTGGPTSPPPPFKGGSDWSQDRTSSGGRTYARQSRQLAQELSDALQRALSTSPPPPFKGGSESGDSPSRGIREAYCRVLLGVAMPSALVEMGCLSNAEEETLLASEAQQVKLARGLAEGVRKFTALFQVSATGSAQKDVRQ